MAKSHLWVEAVVVDVGDDFSFKFYSIKEKYDGIDMKDEYLQKQIITYMGNKRKLLPNIESILKDVCVKLGKDTLRSGDAFSGSGIVARLLKRYSSELYVNDRASYSTTLNRCYLSSPNDEEYAKIVGYVDEANKYVHEGHLHEGHLHEGHLHGGGVGDCVSYIEKNWASETRRYYTKENGGIIDRYRGFIGSIPDEYRSYLMANLLVKCSINNNTNGHFSAFYKDDTGEGKYGGKNGVDTKRITKKIVLENPVLCVNECRSEISCMDTNEWVSTIPELDVVYIDPPYNKHPYSIYYFMLDIINDLSMQEIPETTRGQPMGWERSDYNSYRNAEAAFADLIKKIRAKFLIISYSNKGIIPVDKLESILANKGVVTRHEIDHKTYNKLEGLGDYKRTAEKNKTVEYLWVVAS